jgi:hypothetical protein
MLEKRPQQYSFEIWEGARRLHPERPERDAKAFHSAEETAKRLEALLGNLAGARRAGGDAHHLPNTLGDL